MAFIGGIVACTSGCCDLSDSFKTFDSAIFFGGSSEATCKVLGEDSFHHEQVA